MPRLLLILLALAAVLPARAAGIAIVLNSGSASLSLVDMATQAEVKRIPVLREPQSVWPVMDMTHAKVTFRL